MTDWNLQPTPDLVSSPTSAPEPVYQRREQVIRTPKLMARGQLTGTSDTTVYTAPSLTNSPVGDVATAIVHSLHIVNCDSSARTISVHIIESGGSVANNRLITPPAVSIPAGTAVTFEFGDFGLPMNPGEFISLDAGTANQLTYRISGEELTY